MDEYQRKRDFTRTPEPSGAGDRPPSAPEGPPAPAFPGWYALPEGRRFCVQMHRATRMHFDLRLEHRGVLLSWAVPRGPSLDPAQKRLAVHVEDHPIEYGEFEGVIPSGYGAGTVMLWDAGTMAWEGDSATDVDFGLSKGHLQFRLDGVKLQGSFDLIRIRGRSPALHTGERGDDERAWLLVKRRDDAATAGWEALDHDVSIKTGRSLAAIAASEGGDPKHPRLVSDALQAILEQAPQRDLPHDLRPMTATALDAPFSRAGWVFELKYDGVRALVTVRDGRVAIRARSGREETGRYPELAALPDALTVGDAVLDGEIVALDDEGRPSFERLQSRINVQRDADVRRVQSEVAATFVAFDLLAAQRRDLRGLPLRLRKQALRLALRDSAAIRYADHVETDGEVFFEALCARGLEGMVAKRADSPYEAGRRSLHWLKVKAWATQDCVICGYTSGRGRREALGALVLGVYDGGVLHHAGQVGTGFDDALLCTLKARLDELRTDVCPFPAVPEVDMPVTWVRPELVCEVRYSEWTTSGTLRQSSFRGLRPDVRPDDCVRERVRSVRSVVRDGPPPQRRSSVPRPAERRQTGAPAGISRAVEVPGLQESLAALATSESSSWWEYAGRRIHLTNLDKVLWPEDGYTKRDMIAYYARMAPLLVPYLRDRPLGTQVFPDGIHGKHFWRKEMPAHAPEWMTSWTYRGERHDTTYIVVCEPAALAWTANAGVIDLHPWHSRIDAPEQPDWAVFDLDPFPPAGFAEVLTVARLVKAALDHYGLGSLVKTSGQTGLQVYVPIGRGPDYRTVRHWVEEVARAIGRVVPDLISWDWTVARRAGRIRIDYTQNILNKTLAAPYSLRPVPGAAVSMPIRWEELDDPDLRPDRWTIRTVEQRVAEVGDLFAPLLAGDQDLPA